MGSPTWVHDLLERGNTHDPDRGGHARHIFQERDASRVGRELFDKRPRTQLNLEPTDGFSDFVHETQVEERQAVRRNSSRDWRQRWFRRLRTFAQDQLEFRRDSEQWQGAFDDHKSSGFEGLLDVTDQLFQEHLRLGRTIECPLPAVCISTLQGALHQAGDMQDRFEVPLHADPDRTRCLSAAGTAFVGCRLARAGDPHPNNVAHRSGEGAMLVQHPVRDSTAFVTYGAKC